MSIADYLLNTKDSPVMYAIVAYYFAWMQGNSNQFDPILVDFIAEDLDLNEEEYAIFDREAKEISDKYAPEELQD
jgi:hypothetical protein